MERLNRRGNGASGELSECRIGLSVMHHTLRLARHRAYQHTEGKAAVMLELEKESLSNLAGNPPRIQAQIQSAAAWLYEPGIERGGLGCIDVDPIVRQLHSPALDAQGRDHRIVQ
jgi:hypothetical protein